MPGRRDASVGLRAELPQVMIHVLVLRDTPFRARHSSEELVGAFFPKGFCARAVCSSICAAVIIPHWRPEPGWMESTRCAIALYAAESKTVFIG